METRIVLPSEKNIEKCSQILHAGGVVGMPTETVYGLAANALDGEAVLRIFSIKKRPADNPLIVHVPTIESAEELCYMNDTARELMQAFCPGALTVLLPKRPIIPREVNAGLESVAIRIPSHPVALALLRACNLPLAAPSANKSGRPSPTSTGHVYEDLHGKIPFILEGGNCEVGLESTVIDLTTNVPTILRPGGITPAMLRGVGPEVHIADSVNRALLADETAPSPGMRYRHYAPKGQITLVRGEEDKVSRYCIARYEQALEEKRSARILAFNEHMPFYEGVDAVPIGKLAKPETIAQTLFDVLRQLDTDGKEEVFCEVLPPTGIGLAIMNRLQRAASFVLVDV